MTVIDSSFFMSVTGVASIVTPTSQHDHPRAQIQSQSVTSPADQDGPGSSSPIRAPSTSSRKLLPSTKYDATSSRLRAWTAQSNLSSPANSSLTRRRLVTKENSVNTKAGNSNLPIRPDFLRRISSSSAFSSQTSPSPFSSTFGRNKVSSHLSSPTSSLVAGSSGDDRRVQRRVVFSSTPLESLNASPRSSSSASISLSVRGPAYHPYNKKGISGGHKNNSEWLRQQRRHRVYSNPTPKSILSKVAPEHDLELAPLITSSSSRLLFHQQKHQRLFSGNRSTPPPSIQLPIFSLPSPPRTDHRRFPSSSTATSTTSPSGDDEEEDELEEELVEQLLLVPSPPPASRLLLDLLTPPPSSESDDSSSSLLSDQGISPLLKGILKPFDESSMGVGAQTNNAEEGKRKNGRRHHTLKLVEPASNLGASTMKARPIVWGNEGQSRSTVDTPERKSKIVAGAPVASNSKGKGKETKTPTRSSLGQKGMKSRQGGDESDDEERGRPASTSAPGPASTSAVMDEYDEEHPDWLLSPLQALRGSLRSIAEPFIRPLSTSADDEPLEQDRASPWAIPLQLFDVEDAYVRLTRSIVRLDPLALKDPQRTLAPLHQFRITLIRCLRRDLENIRSFPRWVEDTRRAANVGRDSSRMEVDNDEIITSSPLAKASTSSKPAGPKKPSYSELEVTRLRDELGVAQAAIKCLTAICQTEVYSGIYKVSEIQAVISSLLSIPHAPGLAPFICKDLFPFVAFFLRMQKFSQSTLSPLFPSIIRTLSATLNQPDRNRINLGESLFALNKFFETHSRELLENVASWFSFAAGGLWDTGRKGSSVRDRALIVLTRVVKELRVDEKNEDKEWEVRKEEIRNKVAEDLLTLLHERRATKISGLQLLVEQIRLTLPTAGAVGTKVDEAPYRWLVQFLAVLPLLLGNLFIKLESKGIRPYCNLFRHLGVNSAVPPARRTEPATKPTVVAAAQVLGGNPTTVPTATERIIAPGPPSLRPLAALAWLHVIHAFSLTPGTAFSIDLWVMRPDLKPLTVMLSMFPPSFTTPQLTSPLVATKTLTNLEPTSVSTSPNTRRQGHRMLTEALTRIVAGVLGGLGEAALHSRASNPTEEYATTCDEWLGLLLNRMIDDALAHSLTSTYDETKRLGWNILEAISKPDSSASSKMNKDGEDPNGSVHSARLSQLLIQDTFLDCQVLELKDLQSTTATTRKALDRSVDTAAIKSWGSAWVTSQIRHFLKAILLGTACFTDQAGLRDGSGIEISLIKEHILPLWTNIVLCIAQQADSDIALSNALDWLTHQLTSTHSAPQGQVSIPSLAHHLIPVLFQYLSQRILRLAAPASAGNKEPWAQFVTTLLVSESAFPKDSPDARKAFCTAVDAGRKLAVSKDEKNDMSFVILERLVEDEGLFELNEYSNLADALATDQLPALLEDPERVSHSIEHIAKLVQAHPRSSTWVALGRTLLENALFCRSLDRSESEVKDTSTLPCDLALARLLLISSRGVQPSYYSNEARSRAFAYAQIAINTRLEQLPLSYLDTAEILLEASDVEFLALYFPILEALAIKLESSSLALVVVTPLFAHMQRVLSIMENDTQDEAVDVCVKTMYKFRSIWTDHFASSPDLVVPAELDQVIKVLDQFDEKALDSQPTQAVEEEHNIVEELEVKENEVVKPIDTSSNEVVTPAIVSAPSVPQPAQVLNTLETVPPTTSIPSSRQAHPEPTTAAYEADASMLLPDRSTQESSFEAPISSTSREPIISPSLALVDEVSPVVPQLSPRSSLSLLDETPEQNIQVGHERSFAEMTDILEECRSEEIEEESFIEPEAVVETEIEDQEASSLVDEVVKDESLIESLVEEPFKANESLPLELERIPSSVNEPIFETEPPRRPSPIPANKTARRGVPMRRRSSQEVVIDDSESSDDDILIVTSSQKRSPSRSSLASGGSRQSKKAKTFIAQPVESTPYSKKPNLKRRRSSVEQDLPDTSEKKRRSSSVASSVIDGTNEETESARRKKRSSSLKETKSMVKKRWASDATLRGKSIELSPASSSTSSSSTGHSPAAAAAPVSPTTQRIRDSLREIMQRPVDQVIRVARDLSGQAGLQALIEMGEQARAYFERMGASNQQA